MMKQHFVAIITHGRLGEESKNVVEKLVNPLKHVYTYSNMVDSLDLLEERILSGIREHKPDHILFVTDLMGGSCWLLANRIKRSLADVVVIGGFNIPLLVSYYVNHDKIEWEELLIKIVEDAKRGVVNR